MTIHPEFLHRFRQCEHDLRAFIGAMVKDIHAREDLFQEVSRTLWERFEDYDLDLSFGAWARGIAAKKMLEARRKDSRFPLVFPPETIAAVLEAFDATDEDVPLHESALRLCLEELPPRSRSILTMRYDRRQSCGQIAGAVGSTLKAIHQTLRRLRLALHDCIERRITRDELEAPDPSTQPAIPAHHES